MKTKSYFNAKLILRLSLVMSIAIFLALSITSSGFALSTLIDTLATPGNRQADTLPVSLIQWRGQSFRTTATDYILSEVSIRLARNPQSVGNYSIEIYSFVPDSNTPGIQVAAVDSGSVANLGPDFGSTVVTGNLNIPLAASTDYFIVVKTEYPSSIYWSKSTCQANCGGGYASYSSVSTDTGNNWSAGSDTSALSVQIIATRSTAVRVSQFTAAAMQPISWGLAITAVLAGFLLLLAIRRLRRTG